MNIKKMFTTLSAMVVACAMLLPNASVFAASYSQELQDAYNWAYSKSITTMSPIDNANMYGAITRAELAKMLANWAKDKGQTPDTSVACNFTDTASVKGDLAVAIVESCQLGLMGQGISAFRPYDTISRAEFGTALSRALWGNQYEGGTPYYAKHLDALKAAGIMTQIANAESTKEVRGYVMLMLMRSEGNEAVVDCDDPMTVIACTTNTDACPAACKEASDEPVVVKAGDLAVSAQAAAGRKVIVSNEEEVISDLDTLNFKTSEEVSITKVTLERYGYSKAAAISGVRLEDGEGNIIAEERSVNDKDRVTLSLKKDYRTVDGTLLATVVVRTAAPTAAGGTMGFKVVDVESTAKNLNLDDYKPYEYDMVNYDGTEVTLSAKGNAKDYNYEAGESYEIARFKVKAANSAILLKGFTLTNANTTASALDLDRFLDEVTVQADEKEIKAKYSINKDDELVISFDELELAAKQSVTFIISVSLEDFDEYGSIAQYYLANSSDLNATEKKTGTRITVNGDAGNAEKWVSHAFRGGNIKIANTKLGNLDAAAGSEDVVVAEGTITLPEAVKLANFTVTSSNTGVDNLALVIAGEEYDSSKNGTEFTFKNVIIEESGKIQFKADINEDAAGVINFTINNAGSFGKAQFVGAKYDVSREEVNQKDVAGSVSFSKVTVQAGKASLKNNISKSVEFLTNETSRKVVFDGTYTAKKADVDLNEFWMDGSEGSLSDYDLTFYVFVDGEEVGNTDAFGESNSELFKTITVAAGKSVPVKVEAEVSAYGTTTGKYSTFTLYLRGEDNNDNPVGEAHQTLVDMKVVEKGSVTVTAATSKDTLLLAKKDQVVAEFTVKPTNGAEGLYLENFVLSGSFVTLKAGESTYNCTFENAPEGVTYADSGTVADTHTCIKTTTTSEEVAANEVVTGGVTGYNCTFENAPEGVTYADSGTVADTHTCIKTTTTSEEVAANEVEGESTEQRVAITKGNITVEVDGYEQDDVTGLTYSLNEEIPTAGLPVTIKLNDKVTGEVELELVSVNDKASGKTFLKRFAEAVVKVVKQEKSTASTKYTLDVDYDDDVEVTEFKMYAGTDHTTPVASLKNVSLGGDSLTAYGDSVSTKLITKISYKVDGKLVEVTRAELEDFFKIGSDDIVLNKAD